MTTRAKQRRKLEAKRKKQMIKKGAVKTPEHPTDKLARECSENVKRRKRDPKERERERRQFWSNYVSKLRENVNEPHIPGPESVGGIAAKKSVFDSKWKNK